MGAPLIRDGVGGWGSCQTEGIYHSVRTELGAKKDRAPRRQNKRVKLRPMLWPDGFVPKVVTFGPVGVVLASWGEGGLPESCMADSADAMPPKCYVDYVVVAQIRTMHSG